MTNDKKKWMGARFDEDLWDAVHEMAAMSGITPPQIVEEACAFFIEHYRKQVKNPTPRFELMVKMRELDQEERDRSRLLRWAWYVLRSESEDEFDSLEKACEAAGVSMDEVMAEVGQMSQEPKVRSSSDGHQATSWLRGLFQDRNAYPMREIEDKAKAMGFPLTRLREAKRELGLESVRRSNHWDWVMPEDDGRG